MPNHFESSNDEVESALGKSQEVKEYLDGVKSNVENVELSSLSVEQFLKTLESQADKDFYTFNTVNNQYVKFDELNPELESKIENIKQKYSEQREKFKSLVLPKLEKVAKRMTQGAIATVATLGSIALVNQQEQPEYLSKDQTSKEVQWNDATKEEVAKLSREYTLLMKQDSNYREVPSDIFEKRFMDFVKKYAPEIQIIHPNDQKGVGNQMYEWVFRDVLGNSENRAHYVRDVLFYGEKNIEIKDDKYQYGTSSLSDFEAEVSHHINVDWSFNRECQYFLDLLRNKFKQSETYDDVYSVEFQAHELTEMSVNSYLFPKDHNLEGDFVDIYNIRQEYYREFMKMKKYVTNDAFSYFIEEYLHQSRSFNQIQKNKEIIFNNLNKIKSILDKASGSISDKKMERLLSLLTIFVDLNEENPDFKEAVSGTDFLEDSYVNYLFSKEAENPKTAHYYEAVNNQKAEAVRKEIEDYKKVIENKEKTS